MIRKKTHCMHLSFFKLSNLLIYADARAKGQSILFTNHAHLVELALNYIKGVAVINMSDWRARMITHLVQLSYEII